MKTRVGRLYMVIGPAGTVLALGLAALILLSRLALAGTVSHSAEQPVRLGSLAQPSVVYDRDGNVLAVLDGGVNRTPVPFSAISRTTVNAVLAAEDHQFFTHGAIDVRSILRAAATDLRHGGSRQGGSTITQQLIKNTVLTSQKTLSRKIHEAVDAVRLQDEISRDQILDDYLNTVYFGSGAYGVQAAAEAYFGVPAAGLGLAQAAMLAGLIQDPTGYDPLVYPAQARARRAVVLGLMQRYGYITASAGRTAAAAPLPTGLHNAAPPLGQNGYFVQEVTEALLSDPNLGETASQRYGQVFEGGLRITTTLDRKMQAAAEASLSTELPNTGGRFTAAVVAVDPDGGGVRALADGTDFADIKYDVATGRGGSGRQVGSSFKPFVLMAAISEGYSPNDYINGSGPCHIDIPGFAPYTAENYEGEAFGSISLTDALAHSVNCAYLRLGAAVGLDKVVDMARQLGITSPLTALPSLPLGTEELTPLQMASAYCSIDDAGIRYAPHFIQKITGPGGRVIENDGSAAGHRVASAAAAEETTAAMEQVVTIGTGTAAAVPGRQVAGKTGTTSNFGDAWFVGFARQLCSAVWMGSPTGVVPMDDVDGTAVAGGTFPARIWQAFMSTALAGQVDEPLSDLLPPGFGRSSYIAWPPPSYVGYTNYNGTFAANPAGGGGTSTAPTTTLAPGKSGSTSTTAGSGTSTTSTQGGSGPPGSGPPGSTSPSTSTPSTSTPSTTSPPTTGSPTTSSPTTSSP
ncbi:MAG: transglycosylase domain-containing protein [Acidimicrobiales bacterium]